MAGGDQITAFLASSMDRQPQTTETSIQDLRQYLKDDVKVKVAGECVITSVKPSESSGNPGIDGTHCTTIRLPVVN